MEQIIIKNGIIKKLLIVIVISAMLFNYILPLKMVYAVQVNHMQMNFDDYVIHQIRKLGKIIYINNETKEEIIYDFTDERTWTIYRVWSFIGEADRKNSEYYEENKGALRDIYKIIDKVVEKIKDQVEVTDNSNIDEAIEILLEYQGFDVDVIFDDDNGNVSDVNLSKVDFNTDYAEGIRLKETENNSNDDNKIDEGVYKAEDGDLMDGDYYCTANAAGKRWDTNYIYGIIQDKLIRDNDSIEKEKDAIDWPKFFEDYGDDITKIRIYFSDEKQPTSKNVWVGGISPKDLSLNENYQLPGEPTYSTKPYEEEEEETGGADLGGILLSPVFALVNFVADAVVSGIGSVMIGKGSGVLGTGVLSDTKPTELNYENTDTHEIDMTSFKNLKKIQYPHITYTPEEIFSGNVDILSIDFISGQVYDKATNALRDNKNDGWKNIRKIISQWYQIFRMIAIIGFLSVLIYTGIKIIISSNAKDKAKYKEWIINWLIGVTILFFMHYIMAFTVSFNREFSNLVSKASNGIHVVPIGNEGSSFDTNLMGLVRFMIQSQNFFIKIAYETMYIALIVYTIKFTVTYIRRVLYMAFLTLIAPIVALTYPIDKMNDGSAQGFNMWLKEYVFNALLQPMHCILYYVLVGSAIDVAANNPIYGIVVLAFMTQAEKIFKKIFGFDKANPGTVGGMADAFAAGAIASNIAKMVKFSKNALGKDGNAGGNAQNNLLDNVKPLKDGPVEDNFQEDSLGGGNSANSANGNTTNANSNNGNTANGATVNANSNNGNTANGATANANSNNRNTTNGTSPTNNGGTATGKGTSVKNGFGNVGKKLVNPIYASGRAKGYNRRRWKRRLGKAAKGIGRFAVGATLGTAAAAVQAGISITDGKYSLKEGIASFAAGYAGGGKLTSGIGRAASSVSETFKEGYYEGDQGALIEKQKEQFMDNDEIYKMYKNKYGKDAGKMQQLAADNMVPYGYTDVKEQFKIQKMADEIVKRNSQYDMEKALKQARNTKSFIDSPGISGIVHSPGKQEDYIKAELKSRGITDENSQEAQTIRKGLQNAFKSAAVWQQVNK